MDSRKRSAVQALLWSSYSGLSIAMIASFGALSGSLVFVMVFVGAALWGASESLRALALRRAWLDLPPRSLLLRMLLAPPLFAFAVQVLTYVVNSAGLALGLLQFPPGMPRGWLVLMTYTFNTSVLLWLWIAVWVGVQMINRWRNGEIAKWKAETAARELELQVLRAQINPHFLFNALNNLRALINEDPARAREMLSRLSNTLRHTLQHSAKERVPLADELAVVRDYVALEQLHHEERLRVDWQVDPATADASVPPMLLQLLVENAIKHGLEPHVDGGELRVTAARQGGRLTLEVADSGAGLAHATDLPGTGFGLAQVRERLAQRYGDKACFDLRPQPGGGSVASIEIPA